MLTQALRRACDDDSGMSIIEVVVASFILFFVLTAVLGLVGATTSTSIAAKQRTAMTNAVASYIEYARSLPFEEVALSSVDPNGGIEPVVTISDGVFTIRLTMTIVQGTHNTRELTIAAECSAPGHPTIHSTAFAAIRDRLEGASALGQPHSGGPRIDFGTATPPENSIVYESTVAGLGALYIDASAESTSGTIYTMEFRVGDQRLRDDKTPSAADAYWTPGTASTYQSIRWHTQQVRGVTDLQSIADGWRIVRILATDDLGRQTFKDRRFLLDNHAPAIPGVVQAMDWPRRDVAVLLNWAKALDGTDPAPTYVLEGWKEAASGGFWTRLGPFTLTQPSHTLVTTTFGRYTTRVKALSPRGLESALTTFTAPFVSRPLASGTATCTIVDKIADVKVRLNCSAPDFPAVGVRYDLYRGTSTTALALVQTSTAPTFTDIPYSTNVYNSTKPVPQYYYQVKVTFTPTGWSGGVARSTLSNIVGPTPSGAGSMSLGAQW